MKRILFFLMACLLVQTSFAANAPQNGDKLDSLLVYGEGFKFFVKEPAGWKGDVNNAAQFSTNIIFYPASKSVDTAQAIIRVLIADKTDEHVDKDLAYDMNQYRKQYPGIEFKALKVSHPAYMVYPKLFTVPGSFYEYVTYVNPGPSTKLMFSVAMNIQKKPASKSELDAYRKVIASLHML